MIATFNRYNSLFSQGFNQFIGSSFRILTIFVIDVLNVFGTNFLHSVFGNVQITIRFITNGRDITKYRTTLTYKVFQDWVLEGFVNPFVNGEACVINQGYNREVLVLTIIANRFHKGI